MEVFSRGKPSFDNLLKWEKEALFNPLLETIKDFYKNPDNQAKFEAWLAKRNQLKGGEENGQIRTKNNS